MEIRETSRARSPILLQEERVGLQVNWLLTGVGRAYLAYCPARERQRIIEMLRNSDKAEDRLARQPARLNAILEEVRARGYATRDPTHVGGWYGKLPHADGLSSIAVPLRERARVLGAINIVWLKTAYPIEIFAVRHLSQLQEAAADIVEAARRPKKR